METKIEKWEVTLPDGTQVIDEIEYAFVLSVTGIQLEPQRNRRIVVHPDGETATMPVPENFSQNREDLEQICSEWHKAEEVFSKRTAKREELYTIYKSWLSEHLQGQSLVSLFAANASTKL